MPRTGFLARAGFLGLGSLSVSMGYGPLEDEELEEEEPEGGTVDGSGRSTRISARGKPAPRTNIRYPERESSGVCDKGRRRG